MQCQHVLSSIIKAMSLRLIRTHQTLPARVVQTFYRDRKMFTFAILVLIPALALAADYTQLEHKLFGALDKDSDGKITKPEGEAYFLGYDADKDGDISEAEFTASVDKLDPAFAGHEDALYKLLDRNGDGEVDKSDLDAVFLLTDSNGDGNITPAEFHVVFQAVITQVG